MIKRMVCLPYENSFEQRDRGEFAFRNQRKLMKENMYVYVCVGWDKYVTYYFIEVQ